jgi:glycosyltransferase involved in cell wall biosynthesis
MRILLNTKPLVFSKKTGIGYYIDNLYRELRESGIDVIPTFNEESLSFVGYLGNLSSRLRALIGKRYPAVIGKIGDALIDRLHKQEKNFDIYHETSLDPIAERTIKSVCSIYDFAVVRYPEYFWKDFAKNVALNVAKNALTAERVIVTTQFIKDEAVSLLNIPEEKVDIIPLAPAAMYYPIEKSESRPAEIKKFTGKEYILYVGTVEPRKNLKTLVTAFREIRLKNDIALIIAGGLGWLYDDIIRYPDELGIHEDVIFTEYVDEKTLLYLYNYALFSVYPSFYEGFGLPPLEAMSCGLPVIISDIPPLTEVCGDAALVFNPGDYEGLADRMERLLSGEALRSELRTRGLRRAREYSWRKTALSTIATYEKAMEK